MGRLFMLNCKSTGCEPSEAQLQVASNYVLTSLGGTLESVDHTEFGVRTVIGQLSDN
jgi:hypothetical protein